MSADFANALARFDLLRARDGPHVTAQGRSLFLHHGAATRNVAVLLHGLTNAPQQWATFGTQLHAAGWNVVVPRLPGHGFADRSGRRLAGVRARDFERTSELALYVACSAAERVVVAGLSIGGGIAARLALDRPDVARCVVIVPLFGLRRLPAVADALLASTLRTLPSYYVAWDPTQVPSYGYLRFPTRVLGETLALGLGAVRDSRRVTRYAPVTLLLNAKEPAIENALALRFARRLERVRSGGTTTTVLSDLPANHDIIDPTNPHARVDLVYPVLQTLMES